MLNLDVRLNDQASSALRGLTEELRAAMADLGAASQKGFGDFARGAEEARSSASALREGASQAGESLRRQSLAAREASSAGRDALRLAGQVAGRFGQAMGEVLRTGKGMGDTLRKFTARAFQDTAKFLVKLAAERVKTHSLERRMLRQSSASETAREGKGIFLKVFRFFSSLNPFIASAAATAFTALALKGAEKVAAKLGGLREGGLVERESLVRFAEGDRPELALPLDNPRAQEKIREALGGPASGGGVIAPTINIQGFGDEESVVRDIARVLKRLRDEKDVSF